MRAIVGKWMVGETEMVITAVVNGFTPDPGSDLDDEQPIHICIPLGEYRRASRLLLELRKL